MQCWSDCTSAGPLSIRGMKHKALGLADRLIACSNAIRDESGYPTLVIGNPYDSNLFNYDLSVSRTKAICFLGRLVNIKGADMLLRAFAALQPSEWRLTIIGDGPDRLDLERLVYTLGIQKSVDFLGPLQGDALAHVLNQQEILVVPSRWREPFGIVALEGLACGCVVLASDDGGLVDAVGPAGLLFRRGDLSDLADKLSLLVRDHNLRRHLRDQAPTHLLAFQRHVVSRQYLAILEQLVDVWK
jgi:glycosyltransferase involved in cell wall biosynthesis